MLSEYKRRILDRRSYERLLRDHAVIESKCGDLLALAQTGQQSSSLVSADLLSLAVTLADHLGVEDEVVDLTALSLSGRLDCHEAAVMRADLDVLRRDWTEFLCRWTRDSIAAHWTAFRYEIERMVGRLVDQVHRENEAVYGRALDNGAIVLGAVNVH